jgi:hypothetical protein
LITWELQPTEEIVKHKKAEQDAEGEEAIMPVPAPLMCEIPFLPFELKKYFIT